MSFIPNTTPTPNWLYNGEMKKMSDVELRVVLVVTRATLGWEADHETGMRKKEDWISKSQIVEKTGRGSTSISRAINTCIEHGWIEARDRTGELLDTPEKRSGNRIFFRLGSIFTDKLKTSAKSEQVEKPVHFVTPTSAKSEPQPVPKVNPTKETLTKETLQTEALVSFGSEFKNVLLSESDYTKLCDLLGEKVVLTLIDELDDYIESSGKKYRSHYATLRGWARRKIQEHRAKITNRGRGLA